MKRPLLYEKYSMKVYLNDEKNIVDPQFLYDILWGLKAHCPSCLFILRRPNKMSFNNFQRQSFLFSSILMPYFYMAPISLHFHFNGKPEISILTWKLSGTLPTLQHDKKISHTVIIVIITFSTMKWQKKNQLPAGDLAREHNWHLCMRFVYFFGKYVVMKKSNPLFL